jgi:hypothetical protein
MLLNSLKYESHLKKQDLLTVQFLPQRRFITCLHRKSKSNNALREIIYICSEILTKSCAQSVVFQNFKASGTQLLLRFKQVKFKNA